MARLRLEADKAWKATGMKFGLYLDSAKATLDRFATEVISQT